MFLFFFCVWVGGLFVSYYFFIFCPLRAENDFLVPGLCFFIRKHDQLSRHAIGKVSIVVRNLNAFGKITKSQGLDFFQSTISDWEKMNAKRFFLFPG